MLVSAERLSRMFGPFSAAPVFITGPGQFGLIGYRLGGSQVASSRASDWAGSVCYKRRAHSDC